MDSRPIELIAGDLAPGDAAARDFDWSGLRVQRIRSPAHPLFAAVYERLWREFGGRGEMERQAVIAARLAWDPARPIGDHALRYEMLAVLRGDQLVAVRDHTAIAPQHPSAAVIVHLSHVIVEPSLRGSGLAGWLRALPVQTARECVHRRGDPAGITLVAEMEHPDGVTPMVGARLRSYQRAGFLMIDPHAVPYHQPDFRHADAIDGSAIEPLPLALLVRRIGREAERTMAADEVREIVAALYAMFALHVRADHMAPLWALLQRIPPGDRRIALHRPCGDDERPQ